MSTPIDYYDFRTYLPILPVLVILYRIFYKRCAGTPEQRFSCCRKSKAPVLVKLPNGMQVHSHQKGETDFLYKEVWEQREYAHKNFTCYDQKNPIIFDVGANIGMFSMFAAKECLPNTCTIHSFEPIPTIHALCKANLATHAPTATAHRLGLSDQAGEATFNFHPNFSLHSSGVDEFETRRQDRLRTDLPALLADMEEKNKVPWVSKQSRWFHHMVYPKQVVCVVNIRRQKGCFVFGLLRDVSDFPMDFHIVGLNLYLFLLLSKNNTTNKITFLRSTCFLFSLCFLFFFITNCL